MRGWASSLLESSLVRFAPLEVSSPSRNLPSAPSGITVISRCASGRYERAHLHPSTHSAETQHDPFAGRIQF